MSTRKQLQLALDDRIYEPVLVNEQEWELMAAHLAAGVSYPRAWVGVPVQVVREGEAG